MEESEQSRSVDESKVSMSIYEVFTSLSQCLSEAKACLESRNRDIKTTDVWSRTEIILGRLREIFRSVELRIQDLCNNEWEFLCSQEHGLYCNHTIATMCVLYCDPEFQGLDMHDQNLLLWALMFHDIHKRGRPLVCDRDPFHPFLSAADALNIFKRFKWIDKDCRSLAEFINSSYKIGNYSVELIDNSRNEEIIERLLWVCGAVDMNFKLHSYEEVENRLSREEMFVIEIIMLILFHQSLDISPTHRNASIMTHEEVRKCFSKRMVHLLYVLHRADTNSYRVGECPYNKWIYNGEILAMTNKILKVFEPI